MARMGLPKLPAPSLCPLGGLLVRITLDKRAVIDRDYGLLLTCALYSTGCRPVSWRLTASSGKREAWRRATHQIRRRATDVPGPVSFECHDSYCDYSVCTVCTQQFGGAHLEFHHMGSRAEQQGGGAQRKFLEKSWRIYLWTSGAERPFTIRRSHPHIPHI